MTENQNSVGRLNVTEAAKYLGVSVASVRRWTDSGQLPCWRTPGKQRRFSREDLDRFAEERK